MRSRRTGSRSLTTSGEDHSPQKVRKKSAEAQRMATVRDGVSAGQAADRANVQRLPTERGEFELYYDI